MAAQAYEEREASSSQQVSLFYSVLFLPVMGSISESQLEAALYECRKLVLDHGVSSVNPGAGNAPHQEQFWRFSLGSLAHHGVIGSLVKPLSTAYQRLMEDGAFSHVPLVTSSRSAAGVIREVNNVLRFSRGSSPPGQRVLFDDGTSDGGVVGHTIDLFTKDKVEILGIYALIGFGQAPYRCQTVAEVARQKGIPFVGLLPKQDLARRLYTFGRHKTFLDAQDPRQSYELPNSAYRLLLEGNDIAAALPPRAAHLSAPLRS